MENKSYLCFILISFSIYLSPNQIAGKNKYTVKVIQPDAVLAPVIRSVTISPENKSLIAWEEVPNENIQYIKIYRDASNPEDGWINAGKTMVSGN